MLKKGTPGSYANNNWAEIAMSEVFFVPITAFEKKSRLNFEAVYMALYSVV